MISYFKGLYIVIFIEIPQGGDHWWVFLCVLCRNEEVRTVDGNQEPLLFDSRHLCSDCLCY